MTFEESSDIVKVLHAFDVGFDSSVFFKQFAFSNEVAKIEQLEENEVNIGHVVANEEFFAAKILLNAFKMSVDEFFGQFLVIGGITFNCHINLHVHYDSKHHLNISYLVCSYSEQLGVVLIAPLSVNLVGPSM